MIELAKKPEAIRKKQLKKRLWEINTQYLDNWAGKIFRKKALWFYEDSVVYTGDSTVISSDMRISSVRKEKLKKEKPLNPIL